MAKQTIDIGTSPNKGDGEPIRSAFNKINENFTELYDRDFNTDSQTLSITGDTLSISNGNSVDLSKYVDSTFSGDYTDLINKPSIPTALSELSNDTGFITADNIPTDFKGSVFADDSTLLVDAVNGVIPYSVLDNAPTALSDFSNDLDYAAIVATQIQTNGLPVDTTATGDFTVDGTFVVKESYNATPTVKYFEIESDTPDRILRSGSNMSSFGQAFGPTVDFTSYRSSFANGDAGPNITFRASTAASPGTVISTIQTEVTDVSNGTETSKLTLTTLDNGSTVSPIVITGNTIDFNNATVTNLTAPYTPNTNAHWADPNPTTVGEALDRLAAAVYAVNDNSSI